MVACSSDTDSLDYMQMSIEDLIPIAESGDVFAQFVAGYDYANVANSYTVWSLIQDFCYFSCY